MGEGSTSGGWRLRDSKRADWGVNGRAGGASRWSGFFELDFVVNKRRHTQHDVKHTIARTAPHPAPAPAPPAPAPPRWERDEEMEQPEERSETNTYGRVQ